MTMTTTHTSETSTATAAGEACAVPTTPGATVTHLHPPVPAPAVTLQTPEGQPQPLADLWQQHTGITALIMLRHAGCPFCKAQVRELRDQRAALERAGIQVICILPEEPATVAQFRTEQQVPFTILADPQRETYGALGAKEGSAKEMLNLNTLVEGAKAALHGNLPTLRRPNHATQLPGAALISNDGQMHWIQRAAHAADHASSADLIAAAASVGVRSGQPV